MSNLFRRAAIFGDLHFGQKSNGITHNEDCLNYIRWFISTAQEAGCDICLFLGDYFHNRNNTNLITMNYGLQGLRLLGDAFDRVIMIPGNHDLYYKDQRTVNSIAWANHIQNIEIVNEITTIGGVTFAPWLVKDEYRKVKELKTDYLMCHIELPKFLMNGYTVMPDIGELKSDQLCGFGHVFSGHFHKRQTQQNITYIGNAFPHNFSDAGDDDRGMVILNWGDTPIYKQWPGAPKYRQVKISELVVNPADYLPSNSYVKLFLDSDVSYEEAAYLKENLVEEYELREMSLVSVKKDIYANDLTPDGNILFQSVDSIVQNQITGIASEFYDSGLLLDIYKNLD